MIVDAPTDGSISTSLNVRQDFLMTTQSMPLNETGRHIKFVIAAKFNHSAPSGWPVLQIRRSVSIDNVTTLVMTRLDLEPRPTGCLNVFEYELLPAEVQPRDVVHIRLQSQGQQRYLLAYQTLSNPFQPQVYVNVSTNNDGASFSLPSAAPTSILSTSTVTTEHSESPINTTPRSFINESSTINTPKSATTTNKILHTSDSVKGQSVIAIAGGVLSTLLFIILSIVMIITLTLTFYRCKKKHNTCSNIISHAEVSNTQNALCIENIVMETNPVYITNSLPTESNVAYDTTQGIKPHDYDYVVL